MRPRLFAPAWVWSAAAVCLAGFVSHRLWMQVPWARVGDVLGIIAVALAVAALLRRWRGWTWADASALVWLAVLSGFAGVLPTAAALLLGAAACAIGSLLLPHDARLVLALPVGLAWIGGIVGWTLLLPIHYRLVYLPTLLCVCVVRWRTLRAMATDARAQWRAAVDAAPSLAVCGVFALGLASIGAWLPTMLADDLAYHLALPSQLLRDAVYRPEPAEHIWALAPWLGDVLQGIAQVLAGGEARGAVNSLWLLSAAAGLWSVARHLHADTRTRWLIVALFGTLPLLAALVAGMQTELPAIALLLALTVAIFRGEDGNLVLAGAVLAAGLFELKFGHAIAAWVLLIWALARARGRLPWKRVLPAFALFLALASSSYVLACALTGNPLFPLFNDVFASPLMPAKQLDDLRWHAGFNFTLPWAITFDTGRYLEAWDGGFGFVLIALAGAWLLALVNRSTRGFTLAATAVLLLPMLPMQYARYAFPGLVLLLPPLLVAQREALGERLAIRFVLVLCAFDIMFQANANWIFHVNTVHKRVAMQGVAAIYQRYVPERALIAYLREQDSSESTVLALDPNAAYIAELGRRGRTVTWYAPKRDQARVAAETDSTGAAWQALIADVHPRWLLLRPAQASPALRAGLARSGAHPVKTIGEAELWTLGESIGSGP
ncbi:MAG: hypothetical protein LBQ20_08080 [Rhodanobacter sp.]|jgi:hypothetical protein|nr:hypothetical protein [Rhodanobacter sp.]